MVAVVELTDVKPTVATPDSDGRSPRNSTSKRRVGTVIHDRMLHQKGHSASLPPSTMPMILNTASENPAHE